MSEEVERKLVKVLDEYTVSPFGNPIPGLEELDAPESAASDDLSVRLPQLPEGGVKAVTITQINEILQVEPTYMKRLHAAGILPGADAEVEIHNGRITLSRGDHSLDLPADLAHAVMVIPK